MTDTPELLPCPFCGGEAKIYNADLETYYAVSCTNCDMAVTGAFYESEEEAAKPWNLRVPPKAEPDVSEFYVVEEPDLAAILAEPADGAPDTVWITDGQYPYFKDGWTGGDWSCDDGQCGEPYTRADLHQADLAERDARIAELEAGYTSDGNLWRFWRDKVFDSVGKNTELHKRLATARNDALEEAANKLKETSNKLRQLGQSQGRVNDFEQASCTILALKSEVG